MQICNRISFYTTLYFLIDDIDGQYHPVDSSELSFKTATKYAIAEVRLMLNI